VKETSKLTLQFIVVVTIAIAGIAVGGNMYSQYQCDQYERITGIHTEYSNFDTCYIELNGKMARWSEYLERVKASEVLK